MLAWKHSPKILYHHQINNNKPNPSASLSNGLWGHGSNAVHPFILSSGLDPPFLVHSATQSSPEHGAAPLLHCVWWGCHIYALFSASLHAYVAQLGNGTHSLISSLPSVKYLKLLAIFGFKWMQGLWLWSNPALGCSFPAIFIFQSPVCSGNNLVLINLQASWSRSCLSLFCTVLTTQLHWNNLLF